MLQLIHPKRFGEDVDHLPISSNILKFDFTAQNPIIGFRVKVSDYGDKDRNKVIMMWCDGDEY